MLLRNARVLQEDFVVRRCDVRIRAGRISEIGSFPSEKGLDAADYFLFPGLVESHFHGAVGEDFHEADQEGIRKIAAFEAARGITTIIPTLASASDEVLGYSLKSISRAIKTRTAASAIRGIHLECLYFSPQYRGSDFAHFLQRPSVEKLERFIQLSEGHIRSMTLAPELEGAMDVIRYARKRGITIQLGHTGADYETAMKAIEAGAMVATHTFNAMVPLHHRAPGILGAVLTDDRVTCEMIGDLIHLHGAVLQLLCRVKGMDRVSLVSDSMYAAGLPEGTYTREGRTCIIHKGAVRLPDGTISGSTFTLLDGVKNLVELGIPVEQAIKAASLNPARTLGLSDRIGSISVGKEADFFLTDENWRIQATYVGGECVYRRGTV